MASPEPGAVQTPPDEGRPLWLRTAMEYGAACLLTVACVVFIFRLWQADLRVPLHYAIAGDVLSQSAQVKGLVENWWVLSNPRLGAPFGQRFEDYPLPDNLHFGFMKALSFLVRDWAMVLNLYYLIGFPLAAATCLFALRQLGIRAGPAVVTSVLYALLPYHFIRAQAHLLLASYYLVPLICLILLWVASGRKFFKKQANGSWAERAGLGKREGILGLTLCILAGAAGVYYAFFACVLLVVAGGIAAFERRSLRTAVAPAVFVMVIGVSSVISISPSFLYAARHGRNPSAVVRDVTDAERYSLRITQLVLPVTGHRLPILQRIKNQYNVTFSPAINENDSVTLGIVGVTGFCILLAWVIIASRKCSIEYLDAASKLNIAALLFATTSGFGVLASMAVIRQIRAYNRISVYLAFLSLFAVASILQRLGEQLGTGVWRRTFSVGSLMVILFLGIADQTTANNVPPYSSSSVAFRDEEEFIRRIESNIPPNSMVFQLPYMPFPEVPPVNRMQNYDPLRAYLHSRTTRWSYGAMKGREADSWLRYAGEQPAENVAEFVALAGYAGIYIDRFGFADGAVALERELARRVGPAIVSSSQRFAFFNLMQLASNLRSTLGGGEWTRRRQQILEPILENWAEGCAALEGTMDANWRWCAGTAYLTLNNLSSRPKVIELTANLATGHAEPARIRVRAAGFSQEIKTSATGAPFSAEVIIPPGPSSVRFDSDARPLVVLGDPRPLIIRISNFKVEQQRIGSAVGTER